MSLSFHSQNAAAAQRARTRIQLSGFTMRGHKVWSQSENQILEKYWPNFSKMEKRLPGRTSVAIRCQCRKLGFRRRLHVWSGAEIAKLRRMYPASPIEEICAAFPHSTWINIRQVARYHRMRRKRVGYVKTGFPALDAVRDRCYEIRWTMVDLDKAARTGCYFQKSNWIGKKINHRALGRAIEALDGFVKAEWR